MKLLAIETSCDETAVAILEGTEIEGGTSFRVLGNALLSQIDIHKEYGGVFPALAKREHAKNLVPLMMAALEEAEMLHEDVELLSDEKALRIAELLEREPELAEALITFLRSAERPPFDAIAVTYGPGLEPALWVGVNLARALSIAWDMPLVGVNHLEGHILSSLLEGDESGYTLTVPPLPLLSLVISGGHTEIDLTQSWTGGSSRLAYERIGQTRDDAVGEAYDKVARMLGLPYPGGPLVSKLAEEAREANLPQIVTLPRPMLQSGDFDFSFSGLKTAVLYFVKDKELTEDDKRVIAREFEDAVADVLWKKVEAAVDATSAGSVLIGGGVSANENLRRLFKARIAERGNVRVFVPNPSLTGDNAIMIGLSGYYRSLEGAFVSPDTLRADGNLSLA